MAAAFGAYLKHDMKMISKRDKFSVEETLSRCIEIFAQMQYREACNNRARAVYPNPKFMVHDKESKTRQKMFAAGQNFNIYTEGTPLSIACYEGDWQHFVLLVMANPSMNFNQMFCGPSQFSLLFLTMAGHKTFCVNPVTSMKHECNMQHLRIAEYLLDHGLDINIQNRYGYTTLHECVINCPDIQFAALLLKRGANPNLYNIFCSAALHECAMNTNVECTKLLCDNGANPLMYNFQGYRALDVSSARGNIEIYTILQNRARKIREERAKLEYEDADYCFVCNKSNKHGRLYRCDKCVSPERYCSLKCQKLDWKRGHKNVCHYNRNKVTRSSKEFRRANELVFKVTYCTEPVTPMWMLQTGVTEFISRDVYGSNPAYADKSVVIEKNHQKYRDRRQRKFQRSLQGAKNEVTALYPKCGIKQKFVLKIQAFPNQPEQRHFMLCYEKAREYKVRIHAKKQRKAYNTLYRFLRDNENSIEINNAKKAYFYAYVDKRKKLHVNLDEMVAAQPW